MKLPPNSKHLSIEDKFFKTHRCSLLRGFTVLSLVTKTFVTSGRTWKTQNISTFKSMISKDINLSDWQLLMNICSLIKNFEQILLSSTLREIRCPNTELFLVRISLYLDWIRRFTPLNLYSTKYGPEINPYLDSFHAVQVWACLGRKICHHNFTLLTL